MQELHIMMLLWFVTGIPGAMFVAWMEWGLASRLRITSLVAFSIMIGPVASIAALAAILSSLAFEIWLLVRSRVWK